MMSLIKLNQLPFAAIILSLLLITNNLIAQDTKVLTTLILYCLCMYNESSDGLTFVSCLKIAFRLKVRTSDFYFSLGYFSYGMWYSKILLLFFHIDIYVEISPTPVIFYSNHNLGWSEKLIVIEHRNTTRALSLASSRRSWLLSSKLNTCALRTPTIHAVV